MSPAPSIYDLPASDRFFRELKLDPEHVRRFRNAWFKKGLDQRAALAELPEASREPVVRGLRFAALELAERHDSRVDGASKLLFRTEREELLETVILRIDSGRTSLCVSSQVGCAAACAFCATGRMGSARGLSPAEILDQVATANRLLLEEDRRARNIVFMGMGEPFHNEEAVSEAVETLVAARGFAHPESRVLVSTVGIPEAMVRFAERFPRVHLALSLHAARSTVRAEIVPLERQYDVAVLRETVAEVNRRQSSPVLVEMLLLHGLNDGLEDARALIEWLEGLRVHVNVIPYNPIDGAPWLRPSTREREDAFAAEVRAAGYPVTRRYSLGRDIAAACGQLIRRRQSASGG